MLWEECATQQNPASESQDGHRWASEFGLRFRGSRSLTLVRWKRCCLRLVLRCARLALRLVSRQVIVITPAASPALVDAARAALASEFDLQLPSDVQGIKATFSGSSGGSRIAP